MMPQGTAVLADTSIQIARFVHSPEIKRCIERQLQSYDLIVASLVVKQEFKRRLLKEAKYLLDQLERLGSFQRLLRHLNDVLPPQQGRKRNICIQTLLTVDEQDGDADRTERARLYLRSLLRDGLAEFDDLVDHVIEDSGCACAKCPVQQKKNDRGYDLGPDKCSKTGAACGVGAFLELRRPELIKVLARLRELPAGTKLGDKSAELQQAEVFIERVIANPASARSLDPCLKVGDLAIAMESVGIPVVYTMNAKESQHLCRPLGQDLVVRSRNPATEDIICPNEQADWPLF